jgi:hypothetical protein
MGCGSLTELFRHHRRNEAAISIASVFRATEVQMRLGLRCRHFPSEILQVLSPSQITLSDGRDMCKQKLT